MDVKKEIRKLRNNSMLIQFMGLLNFLFGLLSLLLYFNSKLILPLTQATEYQNDVVWLFVGVVFLVFGFYCLFVITSWSRRLIWVYKNTKPEFMKFILEIAKDSESTDYFAILSDKSEKNIWKIALYGFSCNSNNVSKEHVSAKVYFDPKLLTPSVIETEYALYWSMAGSGSAQKLN